MRNLFVAAFALLLLSNPSSSEENVSLPITKVTLYKHGVGYFERSGKVNGDCRISFTFKKGEMPDVLKSFTAIDNNGGKISEVVYDSTVNLEKILEGYPIDLSRESDILSILKQIKGVPIEIKLGSEVIEGEFLGLREKESVLNEVVLKENIIDILGNNGTVRSVKFEEIKELSIKEEETKSDIQSCIETIFQCGKRELKNLSVNARGEGEREVLVGYVVETPVWKTSYRAVITKDKKPYMQCWAIVDNVSSDDWNNISLSLVSGMPVSFIQDLYTPQYKQRPVIAEERESANVAMMAEEGICEAEPMDYDGSMRKDEEYRDEKKALRLMAPAPAKGLASGFEMSQQVRTVAQAAGDLFEYNIDMPISIMRNKSAMVPIVSSEFEGERVSLYNEANRPDNPYSSLWLKNTSGLTLEGGPVTVYEDEVYAGEAVLKTLKPDEKTFVSYAVDLGVGVSISKDSERKKVHHVSIKHGTLYAYYKEIDIKKYVLNNKSKDKKKIVIEHPIRSGWQLLEPKEAGEKTENYYRFTVESDPQKATEFVVKEESVFNETYVLTNITTDDIVVFVSNNYISDQLKALFEKIVELKSEINKRQVQVKQVENKKESFFKDQERIRENMKSLKDTPAERKLAEQYVEKLTAQESEIKDMDAQLEILRNEISKFNKELNGLINTADFEKDV